MCECIKTEHIVAGWMCCHCSVYNGLQRFECKQCGASRCKPLSRDIKTRERFETYEEAYAKQPEMLARIKQQLGEHARGKHTRRMRAT
jgi:hypothetical protein